MSCSETAHDLLTRKVAPKHVGDFRNSLAASPATGEKINHSIAITIFHFLFYLTSSAKPPPPRSDGPQFIIQPPLASTHGYIIASQRGLCGCCTIPLLARPRYFLTMFLAKLCLIHDDIMCLSPVAHQLWPLCVLGSLFLSRAPHRSQMVSYKQSETSSCGRWKRLLVQLCLPHQDVCT